MLTKERESFESRVSEICVKRICINQEVGVICHLKISGEHLLRPFLQKSAMLLYLILSTLQFLNSLILLFSGKTKF